MGKVSCLFIKHDGKIHKEAGYILVYEIISFNTRVLSSMWDQ